MSRKPVLVHVFVALGLAAAGAVAGHSATRSSQPEKDPMAMMNPEAMAEMMQQWEALNAPGAPHAKLKDLEGRYKATMRMFMPGQPPMESLGSATMKMILDGRYLQQEFHGSFMGKPFEGLHFTGFNNLRKQYTTIWLEGSSTAPALMTGSMDPTGKILTLFGQMDEPSMGEIGKNYMSKWRFVDADTHVYESWEVQYGEPFKVFEVEYRRDK